jgi:hypothetical protein
MFKLLGSVSVMFFLTISMGCANNSGKEYYAAVNAAAEAQAKASEARYRALATVAQGGDGQAASAAVMAIALTQDKTIAPQYVESNALKWAQVLTPTIGTLGLGIVQAGVAKNASNNAADVQMASMASNQAIQLGQQDMISNLGGQWAAGAAASGQQLVDLGVAGFGALNNAGDQTVALGVAGLNTADSIAATGLNTNENIATAGIQGVVDTATIGMDNLNDMGQFGMTTVGAVGLAGMDNLTTLGTTGMENMLNLSLDYNDLIDSMNTTNADTLTTTLADANDTNLQGQTNFAQIIADMQATIDAMSAQLDDSL